MNIKKHGKVFHMINLLYFSIMQFNVLTLGQLNVLRLIKLIYYGWAQLHLILSVNLKRLPDLIQVFKFIIFIHPI